MPDVNKTFQDAFKNHQSGNLPEAYCGYERVLSVAPNHPSALHLMGLIKFDRDHDFESALALISKSLEFAPDEPTWLFNYARISAEAGKYEQSISLFLKLLAKDPEWIDASIVLADVYYKAGHFQKALKAYFQILCSMPEDRSFRQKYIDTMKAAGHTEEAVRLNAWFESKK